MEIVKAMFWTILFFIFSQFGGYEASHKCYFSLPKHSAVTFLSDTWRPSTYCCRGPESKSDCYEETSPCPISEVTCLNSGTCLHNGGCKCRPGFTGHYCEIDINECASSPCLNGATCIDRVNGFHCVCPPRMYGVLCDTNICHPTPADVVFVLDSSVSMTEQEFNKQLEFVANFSSKVPIGPHDFQISVVTFSTDVHVEFYLNQYKNNVSLHDAITKVTYKRGTTRTDKGLKAVRTEVFTAGHGIGIRKNGTKAARFVYVLTDGMSMNRADTRAEASELKKYVDTIAAIGIGNEVLHQELLDIASDPSFVYSVKNFNYVYTILRQLVQLCDECETSTATDVAIFLDSSYYITAEQFTLMVDGILHIIDNMNHLNVNGTHVSVTTFSDDIKSIMNMGETFNKNVIKSKVNMVSKSSDEHQVQLHLETVFAYVRDKIFNNTFSMRIAKKFLLIFTNGNAHVNSKSTFEREKSMLEADGVNIVAVGSGEDIDTNGLIKLVTDTFNVFVTSHDLPMKNLDVLQSEFIYSKCNLTGV